METETKKKNRNKKQNKKNVRKTGNKGTEGGIQKLERHLVTVNIMLFLAFILIGIAQVKDTIFLTKTTRKLSEVAQKAGVEFQTKTNNVLGIWQVVKPK